MASFDVDGIIKRLLEVKDQPGKQVPLSEPEVRQLCLISKDIFLEQPCLLSLEAPIKIAGDIQGQYSDLLRLFEKAGSPPKVKYLFLGNYVSSEKQSLETICLLLAYKIKYPEKIYLLRGSRESSSTINRKDGFYDECKRRFNSVTLWTTINNDCFNCLPIAALIDDKIFCVHGGLSPNLLRLDQIRNQKRPTEVPDSGLLCELLWSNPSRDVQGWGKNDGGFSCTFGADKVKEFVQKHDLCLICRGHQVVEGGLRGHEFFADQKLVTIFTAPNYRGEYDNVGCIMDVTESLECSFPTLKPAEKKPQFSSASETQPGSSSGVKIIHNTTTTTKKLEQVAPVKDSERGIDKQMDQVVLDDIIRRLLNHQVGKQIKLSESEVRRLCIASKNIFLQQSCLLELVGPVKIVGDIHGQYSDLLRLFECGGFPPQTNYLFLGNYVDSGRQSLETICLLLAYKIKYPLNFFLLRGNHECGWTNHIDGFYDECKRRFNNVTLWKTINDCFNCLPIAALIGNKIFCIHAGLSPDLLDLDQIRKIPRPTDVPKSGLLCDLLWSDPHNVQGWGSNDRGFSYTFGADKVTEFIKKHHLDLICRGHQVVEGGYELFGNEGLITIFSAPNYRGVCGNDAAVMSVDTSLVCSFDILKPAEKSSSGASLLGDTTTKKVVVITPILKAR